MTVHVPDDLHTKLKVRAAQKGTTIKDLVIDLLENEFGKSTDQSNIEKLVGKKSF